AVCDAAARMTSGGGAQMNIGQLIRTMAGEPQPDQAKLLELRAGQILRGIILQVLEGQDALVQLNGMQVRAKLETPIPPGQSTLLQVQPESARGAIVLKPVDAPAAGLTEESLRDIAKQLGLPVDRRWALELARDLKRDGFPITRETAQAMQQAAAARPADVPEAEWMQAAGAALRRGLPVTDGTVAALRQTMFGKPAGELLETLRSQLTALAAGAEPAEGGEPSAAKTPLPVAAARVLALLAEGETLL